MEDLKKCLKFLKQTVSEEVHNLKLLSGSELERMCENFNFDKDIKIYFNEYNLVFIVENDYLQMAPYLKKEDLVMMLDLPKGGVYMCIHQYFNSSLLEEYIN